MTAAKDFQPEIQGLRAIAVVAVLIFHIWPIVLPGGYVGVDVFLVISGYLITGLLLREAERSGRISIANFYTRRIRRLLPAAVFVIASSCAFVLVLPKVQWAETAKEALASTLYVQNWWLASQAVDYLAEDAAPGLLRHYWSLSVEEQYYIFWPLMYWLVAMCWRSAYKHPRKAFAGIALAAFVFSLVYSVWLTKHNQALAYFSTGTRAWELALGSALAVGWPRVKTLAPGVRLIMGWLGVAAIATACWGFSVATAFPGYAALLPTLGAALVIAAGNSPRSWAASRFLSLKQMTYIGDISYSLYLWHWPVLIAIASLPYPGKPKWHHGLLMVAVSLLLAHLSKQWVEDPFRYGQWRRWRVNNSPVLIMATSVAVVGLIACTIIYAQHGDASSALPTVTRDLLERPYDPRRPTVPSATKARSDNPEVYALKCHVDQRNSEPNHCSFGPPTAQRVIVLVGDSHAAQWLPTLQEVFRDKPDWRIVTFTKSACAFNASKVTISDDGTPYESCSEWNERVLTELAKLRPEIVVIGASATSYRVPGAVDRTATLKALSDGLLIRWKQLLQIGAKVVVLRDTPRMGRDIPECMSASRATVEGCSVPLAEALRPDPIVMAVEHAPADWKNLAFLDFTDQICEGDVCKPIKGQVLIWRDSHHFTATFARLLSERMMFLLVDNKVIPKD